MHSVKKEILSLSVKDLAALQGCTDMQLRERFGLKGNREASHVRKIIADAIGKSAQESEEDLKVLDSWYNGEL